MRHGARIPRAEAVSRHKHKQGYRPQERSGHEDQSGIFPSRTLVAARLLGARDRVRAVPQHARQPGDPRPDVRAARRPARGRAVRRHGARRGPARRAARAGGRARQPVDAAGRRQRGCHARPARLRQCPRGVPQLGGHAHRDRRQQPQPRAARAHPGTRQAAGGAGGLAEAAGHAGRPGERAGTALQRARDARRAGRRRGGPALPGRAAPLFAGRVRLAPGLHAAGAAARRVAVPALPPRALLAFRLRLRAVRAVGLLRRAGALPARLRRLCAGGGRHRADDLRRHLHAAGLPALRRAQARGDAAQPGRTGPVDRLREGDRLVPEEDVPVLRQALEPRRRAVDLLHPLRPEAVPVLRLRHAQFRLLPVLQRLRGGVQREEPPAAS